MRSCCSFLTLIAVAALVVAPPMPRARADVLYIGDAGLSNTVKRFDVATGARWMPGFRPPACSDRMEWSLTATACWSSTRT